MNSKTVSKLRLVSQLLFLSVFLLLILLGKINMWMFIFLAGVTTAAIWGRFYCGWICPVNTLTESIDRIYKKAGLKRHNTPSWIKKPAIRYVILVIFLGTMIFVITTGKKLPILIILTVFAILLSLFFESKLWHRYLCPYGALLSTTGRFARKKMTIVNENCIKCGICKNACSGEAVIMKSREYYPIIDHGLCLNCLECENKCPKGAIRYC